MTNRDRVLQTLAAHGPLDDDELARRSGIEPRQTVNQLCRRLSAEGLIVRTASPGHKITNSIADARADEEPSQTPLAQSPPAAGSAHEQQSAEAAMLAALGASLSMNLKPRRLDHPSGARVEVDGADEGLTVLVECWAHQGPAKGGQKYKLVNDAVKLHWIATSLPPATRQLIICISDAAAVSHLRGRSWQGQAIASLGVELVVVELDADLVASIAAAQIRQYR